MPVKIFYQWDMDTKQEIEAFLDDKKLISIHLCPTEVSQYWVVEYEKKD